MGIFKGGVPTKIEVDLLMKEIEASSGIGISYKQIERVTNLKRHENRFKSVVTAWRKRVFREKLLQSSAEDGTIHFLTGNEAHDLGKRDVHKIGRAAGRLSTRVETVDVASLSEDRRDRHYLLRRETTAMLESVRNSAKAIAGPKPVSSANLRIAK